MRPISVRARLLLTLVVLLMLAGTFSVDAQRRGRKNRAPVPTPTPAPPTIDYTVGMSKPATHLLEVEMKMQWDSMPEKAQIKMAVWTPGSYLVREYARHVQDFVALDGAGNSLDWKKVNKNTWEIDTKGAKSIRVGYAVYANELTVRTNELNDDHAFFTPAALIMYPAGQIGAASTIRVKPFGNWKVATGLKPTSEPNTFSAPNFDILFDSPFEVSDYKEKKFMVRGVPHRYVMSGDGNYDLDQLAEDTAKIIEQAYQIFGELPYDDYTFIVNLRGGGGLEHLNSTALQFNKFGFAPRQRYMGFLGLVAHEYFHLWNVKRIRPLPLGPFDYENENYTKSLWVAEGATSYFEGVLLRRAGLMSAAEVLSSKARIAENLQSTPGRFQTSLEEASFDAWIKYYRTDENSINNQISYYDKGELVNFLLDIQIRGASAGAKSLDDVMRYLYAENFKKGKGYTPEEFQAACELMAGRSLENFFSKYVRGREEIAYDELLQPMGLRMVQTSMASDRAFLGAILRDGEGGVNVSRVVAGTPAYESGVNSGDLIVALDGNQVTSTNTFNFLLGMKRAGDKGRISYFRNGRLREMDITFGNTPASGYAIVPLRETTAEQKKLYSEYLFEDLQ
ncbi:MAG: PDZ domain-containing protein [Pyrinomonadaceae bacterium]